MNKGTGIVVDILFVLACLAIALSFASWLTGNQFSQLYSAVWGCFCLLMAVLLCVYAGRRP